LAVSAGWGQARMFAWDAWHVCNVAHPNLEVCIKSLTWRAGGAAWGAAAGGCVATRWTGASSTRTLSACSGACASSAARWPAGPGPRCTEDP
jgi:hypothetical protein